MTDAHLKTTLKSVVGRSLADQPGDLCMRTKCQDIIPRLLSGLCKDAAHGKRARAQCKPLLQQCQHDQRARSECALKCARYYVPEQQQQQHTRCVRDCNVARCRVYEPYDVCVAQQTLLHVLQCMDGGEGRRIAQQCLKHRCGLHSSDAPLAPE